MMKTGVLLIAIIGTASAGLNRGDLLTVEREIALSSKNSGEFPRGNGCKIDWSYQGVVLGLEWKYMGICTDSCTQETETVFYQSRGGTVEHCIQSLLRKVARHGEL